MSAQFFVTGTDTNAGKTTLAQSLLLAATKADISAIGYKPVETGCSPGQFGPDTMRLAKSANTQPVCSFSFIAPIAPAQAAILEQLEIDLRIITKKASELASETDLLLVEGAGGLLVPLTPSQTIADLAVALAFPVIVVANNRLGAVNHSLLTIEGLRQRNLEIAAFVLMDTAKKDGECDALHNAEQISEYGKLTVHKFPFCETESELCSHGEILLQKLFADTKLRK